VLGKAERGASVIVCMNLKHAAAAAVVAVGATGAVAVAATKPTVKAVKNADLGKTVVIEAKKGMTLYRLSPETKSHLLCKASCTGFWPPLTVKSLHTQVVKGKGITGKLAVFKRPDGTFQVTLRGLPLYRFSGDGAKGQANGEGIQSFGGTWHAVTAKSPTSSATPAAPATPAPSPSTPYPY
jgi:predicted lipoprotein with Yx(FWY)xxD motif